MITRTLYNEEKDQFNAVITHPIQTWEWGDFLTSQGHKVYRLGVFENKKIVGGYSLNFHQIPKTNYTIGVFQRGPKVDQDMINNVTKIAKDENAIFVKFEPEVIQKTFDEFSNETNLNVSMDFPNLVISPKVAFYPYTYIVDLAQTEDELLEGMHQKTRYNIKVANRHNVEVVEATNDQGFEEYIKLLFDTTKRQGFYLHTEKYHRDQWRILKKTSIPHVMLAKYNGITLSAFMLFALKDRLFYPYGASLDIHRETMASTLLMWESIRLGQRLGCRSFDLWGSLGPFAKEGENGYGFHRFKQGFGGQLVQFVGTYDLVINPPLYQIYNLVDKYRWKLLRLKAKIPH
ncbi:peptidoglycan bridge formation glycyltransferase FemA/FemB family protein [Patescibacteria group bacterium]|nr:peptidoglycan bridge formation glycyltransferase FemA/FemB family protein [Patescibacteria group bacterium]